MTGRPAGTGVLRAGQPGDPQAGPAEPPMERAEYARIAAAEDGHWWYQATRALVADLLGPWLASDQVLLDAGCGPGGNGSWLAAHGRVIGVDVAADALRFVRLRRPETIPAFGSVTDLPFAPATFHAAVAITVLYQVDDDRRALAEMARVLRPGGAVVLVEPAFEALRREHDAVVRTRRRYRRRRLVELAEGAGLVVRRATYAHAYLVPAAATLALVEWVRGARSAPRAGLDETGVTTSVGPRGAQRAPDRRAPPPRSDVGRPGPVRLLARLAAAERRVLALRDLPLGLSVVVLATRP